MPSKRKRRSTNINEDIATIIEILAKKEHRSFAGQANLLLEIAIANLSQEEGISFNRIKAALQSLTALELAQLTEINGKLLEEKLTGSESASTLAQLIRANYALCSEAFEDEPQELEDLLNGKPPSPEAEQLLVACLPLSPAETAQLIESEFYANSSASAKVPAARAVL